MESESEAGENKSISNDNSINETIGSKKNE